MASAGLHLGVVAFLFAASRTGTHPAAITADVSHTASYVNRVGAFVPVFVPAPPPEKAPAAAEAPAPEKSGAAGVAGDPASNREARRAVAKRRPVSHTAPIVNEPDVARAEGFGLLAILGKDEASRPHGSAFAAAVDRTAMGNVVGSSIADGEGTAGAALSGTGSGGGGRGEGVHIGGVGTGDVKLPPVRLHEPAERHLRWTVIDEGGMVAVNGRTPPENIQAIVRRGFGRFRGCYEAVLRDRPGLEGRVTLRMEIDRSGAVARAETRSDDVADATFLECLTKATYALSFPPPEGGTITVLYPLVLSPP